MQPYLHRLKADVGLGRLYCVIFFANELVQVQLLEQQAEAQGCDYLECVICHDPVAAEEVIQVQGVS